MNVVGAAAVSKIPKQEDTAKGASYLYIDAPNYELSLDEFEVFALKRLKVLRKIEQLKMMRVNPEQIRQKIDQVIKQELSDPIVDQASHFILRLSYCQTEELRRWFLQYESALFQHRLKSLSDEQLAHSVREYAQLKPIPRQEKERLQDKLMQLMTPTEFATTSFYSVPFQQALDLVANRQCYLHAGYAYVPQARVFSILAAKFRTQLSRHLALMASCGALKAVEDPEAVRIHPLLKNLNRCLVNTDPSEQQHGLVTAGSGQMLTAANLDQFTPRMPLCMRQLQTGLKQDKKLKHWGRLQYGLFLKGAGLSMDDALLFFQRHFTKVTGETFQKQYAYNIRHMYGKEGKRATYTPYNCAKIINGNAPSSVGEHHGCPFKHYDADNLKHLLVKLKIGDEDDRRQIVSLKKAGQYQLACLKHFEAAHPGAVSMDITVDNVGNHPNAWFRASVEHHEHADKGKTDTANAVSP